DIPAYDVEAARPRLLARQVDFAQRAVFDSRELVRAEQHDPRLAVVQHDAVRPRARRGNFPGFKLFGFRIEYADAIGVLCGEPDATVVRLDQGMRILHAFRFRGKGFEVAGRGIHAPDPADKIAGDP